MGRGRASLTPASLALGLLLLGAASCRDTASVASDTSPTSTSMVSAERIRHEVKVDGHPFAVFEKSPQEPADVLVLVHGRTWSAVPDFDLQVPGEERSLMDALVARGFATYAVDLRGYGGTPRDDTGWLTPDRAASDLAGVLEWVAARHPGGRKPVLFGWSYGSMVSHLVVQSRPELVSDLVLFGYPAGPGREFPAEETDPGAPPREPNTAEAAASDFIRPDVISQAAIDAYVEACLELDPVRTDWARLDQWSALDPGRVRVPTLLIHGEHDPYAPLERQGPVFAGLANPDRAWVIVPGGDHAAHMEDTMPRFVHALVSFVRRPGREGG